MSAPASRPIHPCVTSINKQGSCGVEFSCWAHLTHTRQVAKERNWLPNLVTATASTLHVYTPSPRNGKLKLEYSYPHIAGTIVFLSTLTSKSDHEPDALLIGFGGYARLSVVTIDGLDEASSAQQYSPTLHLLQAICLLDFTSVWNEYAYGSTAQEDAIFTMLEAGGPSKNRATTVAVILGGGVAIAVTEIVAELLPNDTENRHGWFAREPYILPLVSLSSQLPHMRRATASEYDSQQQQTGGQVVASSSNNNETNSMVTGWGDIFDAVFLSAYSTAETLVLLHSAPGGATWVGRLARENTSGPPPLYLTALSISVPHARTALLWSLPMTSDARTLYPLPNGIGCLVMGTNTITSVEAGRIQQVLAVNGFARATCPAILVNQLQTNPIGLKLALQLDGSACCFLNSRTALIVLRRCQVYLLQRLTTGQWCMVPTGEVLATMGEVAHLQSYFLPSAAASFPSKQQGLSGLLTSIASTKKGQQESQRQHNQENTTETMNTGLVVAGSRLGDSYVLGFAVDSLNFPLSSVVKETEGASSDSPSQEMSSSFTNQQGVVHLDAEETASNGNTIVEQASELSARDRILEIEENALYAPVPSSTTQTTARPNTVQPSDDEDSDGWISSGPQLKRNRRLKTNVSVLRCLTALDRIINLGPIGPSCEGPLAAPPAHLGLKSAEQPMMTSGSDKGTVFGASAFIFPCGFGSSGSLALATMPGRDDRLILSEEDCINVRSVFSLPSSKLLLLGMSTSNAANDVEGSASAGGIKLLRLKSSSNGAVKWEELEEWTDPRDETMGSIASSSALLDACEMGRDGTFAMFLQSTENDNPYWRIAIVRWNDDMVRCDFLDDFLVNTNISGDRLVASTPILTYTTGSEELHGTACRWASGRAVLVLFTRTGLKYMVDIPDGDSADKTNDEPPAKEHEEDEEKQKIKDFYSSEDIVALDLFRASPDLMSLPVTAGRQFAVTGLSPSDRMDGQLATNVHPAFDEEDLDLYGIAPASVSSSEEANKSRSSGKKGERTPDNTYLAVFRQSGVMELYEVADATGLLSLCWLCSGVERGLSTLFPSQVVSTVPLPSSHMVKIEEARFFVCGPARVKSISSEFKSLCLAATTSNGDFILYTVKRRLFGTHQLVLEREQLKTVCRRTQDQARHRTKLVKKGIIPQKRAASAEYSNNVFFRFNDISGQDGLFAALPQPKWIVSARGKPTVLNHRTRQAAPAGANPSPVTGFCAPLSMGGFLTVHERVGRFGSQRLTIYRGLSPVFEKPGLIPGGGFYVERLTMGVTVRQIQFIDDESVSNGNHPLYAILVSRELEVDQSAQNDDGMTPEEREQLEREKEEARIQRQVEADLGGFDVEQEWVDEIVRDDVFHVDTELGGAPPVQKEYYSLWIVDAANEWRVVDSYDLEEYEHGLTLQVMALTEFKEEPGSTSPTIDVGDLSHSTFVALGTGTVNHNGEDVSSRGRVLLFEVKKADPGRRLTSQVASLSLMYEKEIFHGPVASLSCLSTEGRNRLVISAGADVNVEQWGNGKLTQVGFFRATMQIQNIMLFKNFFLLSDAYDSLYFLVWRESDKSLTLLSKVYDSIVVYAAGIMSRGAAMTFLCHDDRQNVQFFQYAPGEAAARGGNKLVCRADFHLGSQTTAFRQHFCRSSLMVHSATPVSTLAALKQQDPYHGRTDDDQRLGIHFGTTDAQILSCVPLSEPVYWRLTALQSVLANAMESDCALSPRAWRLYRRTTRRGGCRSNDRKKGVIDGDLVSRYADLPLKDQEDLASAIGSTVDLILDNLLEIECSNLML
ncbi:hypothetical protein ACA910_005250 [Epithemia clementina (nom. ined.)]